MSLRIRLVTLTVSGFAAVLVGTFVPVPLMQGRCLSILIMVAIWWIFEPWPAYVTSLFLVPLTVLSGVLSSSSAESAQIATAAFYDPTMFVFLTGFTLASACDKYRLTHLVSSPIITYMNKVTLSDFRYYITLSLFAVSVCGVLSNVAGSILVSAIGQSIHHNRDSARVFLTIAFACNIGGMIVPIASPQNIIAILSLQDASEGILSISWFEWMSFSLPFCSAAILIQYAILKLYFATKSLPMYNKVHHSEEETIEEKSHVSKWSQLAVFFIVVGTVVGWGVFDGIFAPFFGHMGIFGLFSVVVFHASGLLTARDFQQLPWPVLAVLGGGIVLGKAVETSGLLDSLLELISSQIDGYPIWVVSAIFFTLIALIANFFSSTVCAIIFFPLIAKIGISLNHPNLFLIGAALMTSGAMGLPVSSFPNANAAAADTLLCTKDFVCTGFPIGVALLALLLSGGYIWGTLVLEL